MDVIISVLFYFVYMICECIEKVLNLKLVIIVGVGFDYVDLVVVSEYNIGVVEVIGSNIVSVVEYVVMDLLIFFRNYEEGYC